MRRRTHGKHEGSATGAGPFFDGRADALSLDERMNQWLSDEADRCRVPDEERQEFIEAMRGTTAFAVTRLQYAMGDLVESSRLGRFMRWLDRKLERREGLG